MKNKVKVPTKLALSVVAACLVSFCGLITETAVNIAFPAVMSTFGVSTEMVQWLTTGNLLVVAMITPLSAFLQRRFKLRQLFIFGTMCFVVGTVVAIFSPNFTFLLLARLIQGIGTGVGVPIAFCIILEQIPFEKVGTYMGYGALVSAAAPALGPTYGGIINQNLGWRYIFVILIPVLIFTLILGIATIEEKHEPEKVPVDIWGIIFIMLTFLGLVYGFANIGALQKNPIVEIGAFVIGIAALDKIGAKLPILLGTGLMTIGILLFTVFGMKLDTGMIIGFYIIFGIGCGIAFGNTMTVGNLRLPVQQKAYGNTCFNTLMQFAGAVGTSVCAALVSASQMKDNSLSYELKTAAGSTHGFVFLLLLAVVCLLLQVIGFKKYQKTE